MNIIKQIIKCKILGEHTMTYRKGYGYRCACCGKALTQTR